MFRQAVYNINFEYKQAKTDEQIVFSNEYLKRVQSPYNDAVVISAIVAIIIDSGSFANTLFYDAF